MTPRVSVVMPVHNGSRYLLEAVTSILDQTLRSLELVVVDDASTDETPEILDQIKDPRLVVIRKAAVGPSLAETLNVGLDAVQGELVARMDADDVSYSSRLTTQVDFLDRHPDVALVGSWADEIDGNDRAVGRAVTPVSDTEIRWQLNYRNPLHHPSIMVRSKALRAVGGYEPARFHVEDYALFHKMTEHGRLHSLPMALIAKRTHGGSVSIREFSVQERMANKVSQEIIQPLLGHRVPDDLLTSLRWRRFETPSQIRSATELLVELYAAMRRLPRFERFRDQWDLRQVAARGVYGLSHVDTPGGRLRLAKVEALKLNPLHLLEVLQARSGRMTSDRTRRATQVPPAEH